MATELKTKVVTGKDCRFSYLHAFHPKAVEEGQPEKFSVSLLIPKDTEEGKKTIAAINAAVEEAIKIGISTKWDGKKPALLKLPLRDGDAEEKGGPYEGHMFLNCSSKQRPGLVDKDMNKIISEDDLKSGDYGRLSINFYPFSGKSKGVAAGFNNLQKWADGESLGGGASAEDDFGSDFI